MVVDGNRRKERLKVFTEFHSKLIDRMGSSGEFASFLQSDGGKRFLESLSVEKGHPANRIMTAVQTGLVDATLLQPPFSTRAKQEGLHEYGSLGDLGLDYLGTSLATTRQTIQRKEAVVRRFVRGLVEGIHFYKSQKEASIQSIAKFTKLKDRASLEEAYNTYAIKYMARLPYPSIKGVETILEDLAKTNPKARGADAKRFLEPRFLKELDDSGFVAQLYKK